MQLELALKSHQGFLLLLFLLNFFIVYLFFFFFNESVSGNGIKWKPCVTKLYRSNDREGKCGCLGEVAHEVSEKNSRILISETDISH